MLNYHTQLRTATDTLYDSAFCRTTCEPQSNHTLSFYTRPIAHRKGELLFFFIVAATFLHSIAMHTCHIARAAVAAYACWHASKNWTESVAAATPPPSLCGRVVVCLSATDSGAQLQNEPNGVRACATIAHSIQLTSALVFDLSVDATSLPSAIPFMAKQFHSSALTKCACFSIQVWHGLSQSANGITYSRHPNWCSYICLLISVNVFVCVSYHSLVVHIIIISVQTGSNSYSYR